MHADLSARIDALERRLAERLHLRAGAGLPAKLRAARGRLPRRALARARELVDARALLASPGAAAALDAGRAHDTCALLERHLDAVPEGKWRRRARAALWGRIALQVLVVILLVLAVLRWRGLA